MIMSVQKTFEKLVARLAKRDRAVITCKSDTTKY